MKSFGERKRNTVNNLFFRENGMLWQVGVFKDDQKTGMWKRYQENGQLYDEGEYTEGEKTGEWKYYDASGNLTRPKKFKTK